MGFFASNNKDEAVNAAKKLPSARDAHDQGRVDRGSGTQSVRNADYAARNEERVWGKGGNPHKK